MEDCCTSSQNPPRVVVRNDDDDDKAIPEPLYSRNESDYLTVDLFVKWLHQFTSAAKLSWMNKFC